MRVSCPVRPSNNPRPVSELTASFHSSIRLPVQLMSQDKVITTTALIDSGAAGNFISNDFIQQHKLKLKSCSSSLTVEALDGRPLGEGRVSHITEEIQLLIGTLHSEIIKFYDSSNSSMGHRMSRSLFGQSSQSTNHSTSFAKPEN